MCGRFTLRTPLTVLAQQFLFDLGGLPQELNSDVVISAGILANAPAPAAAKEFAVFLTSPAGVAAMKTHGLGP